MTLSIRVNGQPFCESEDVSTVTMVAEERGGDECRLTLHAGGADATLQWLTARLRAGDEIVIRAIDATEAAEADRMFCGFCSRDQNDVARLVTSATTSICDACCDSLAASVVGGTALPVGAVFSGGDSACGFCGRTPDAAGTIVARNGAAICGECLHACHDIVRDTRA